MQFTTSTHLAKLLKFRLPSQKNLLNFNLPKTTAGVLLRPGFVKSPLRYSPLKDGDNTEPESARFQAASENTLRQEPKSENQRSDRPTLLDTDKVSDDLAYYLDYSVNHTAFEKITESLSKTTHEEFNDILRKLEQKDRKMQGLDITLGNWLEQPQRWDSVKLHPTDDNPITWLIVQRDDSMASIADQETKGFPHRTDKDVQDYITLLMRKNNLDSNAKLSNGQILLLPYPT